MKRGELLCLISNIVRDNELVTSYWILPGDTLKERFKPKKKGRKEEERKKKKTNKQKNNNS